MSKQKNKGKFYIGKIKDFSSARKYPGGYFIGRFLKEKGFPLLESDKVAVAWKTFPDFRPEQCQRHTHKESVEICIVVSGWIRVRINGREFRIKKGEFYVIHPFNVTKDLAVGRDTRIVVIRAPAVWGDRYLV